LTRSGTPAGERTPGRRGLRNGLSTANLLACQASCRSTDQKDTVNVGAGERYDVLWTAREPGKWLLHCQINHHTTNDNVEQQGGGGLMLILNVTS
jgi:FtsP/CotA-like multicopper oxidase with cupredoxin domain